MDELIGRIEDTVAILMNHDLERYAASAQELVNYMIALFPAIIECYNNPLLSDIKEDATYWPKQLNRVIAALEKGDYFEVADVLYNETRPNLVELKGILIKRGLL